MVVVDHSVSLLCALSFKLGQMVFPHQFNLAELLGGHVSVQD